MQNTLQWDHRMQAVQAECTQVPAYLMVKMMPLKKNRVGSEGRLVLMAANFAVFLREWRLAGVLRPK